ncbi:MAG: G/T mismatches repair enzyme [Candidatus Methanofastidiosum methylothiophilum]|uniref:Endonuclease III n=1 Tax=Candidatus Methanofastidiosum methylothiophilum TaxID=1705564 RepID=A0A150IKE9_9EURY|nr:MAG: G/T mismatches repair enzyme [Candidatus Methanofastidiosum methylthiophilus]KYC47209.1 MAG: G/T mismatches repair enzyme [Candidatus Methanofastidiosum methylthiophilus]KYC51448.1 MAG: G/T mismatches repair enzyme [Candidatus Methanofastidiosum methylthiophilus]
MRILREEIKKFSVPIVSEVAADRDPYKVLISCVLSLRTKDEVTKTASLKLFQHADTPQKMINLNETQIQKLVYPVGFYKTKAKRIIEMSHRILEDYDGKVPDTIDELLKLKGVGRKTANIVITLGYGKPGVCVDTHVHRISNRWGYVKTKNPFQTEFALREKLPEEHWIEYNDILVTYGQNVCAPISPKCSICTIEKYCPKIGVLKHR